MSASIWATPLVKLSPLLSIIFLCASGFETRKLAGDIASIICCTAKRIFCFALGGTCTASASAIKNRAFSRYAAALNEYNVVDCHSAAENRLSAIEGNFDAEKSVHKVDNCAT